MHGDNAREEPDTRCMMLRASGSPMSSAAQEDTAVTGGSRDRAGVRGIYHMNEPGADQRARSVVTSARDPFNGRGSPRHRPASDYAGLRSCGQVGAETAGSFTCPDDRLARQWDDTFAMLSMLQRWVGSHHLDPAVVISPAPSAGSA